MEHKKTKIVLDADVIIHFMEANYFSILPDIFPEYEYLILDVVYNEISQNSGTKDFIDKYLHFFHKLKKEVFSPKRESMKEFFLLQRTPGCSHGVVHKLIAEVIDEVGMADALWEKEKVHA